MPGKKIEFTGSQADLKMGPRNMIQDGFSHGTVEMTGSEAMLSQRTTPLGDYSGRFAKNDRGGSLHMTGSEADLKVKSEHRGWESASTPISDNSQNAEDTTSSFRNGRGK